jgi:hypothetical protein
LVGQLIIIGWTIEEITKWVLVGYVCGVALYNSYQYQMKLPIWGYRSDDGKNQGGGGEKKPPEKKGKDKKGKPPGIPTKKDGFEPSKNSDGKKVKNPNGSGSGYRDKNGDVWIPTDHKGRHAPHWDVQHRDGTHTPVYPKE